MDTAHTGRRVLEGILVATPLTVGLVAATGDDSRAVLPAVLLGVGLFVAVAARPA